MEIRCPLCGGSFVTVIESIFSDDITVLYRRVFGIAMATEFGGVREIFFYRCETCDLKFFHPQVAGSESLYEKLQVFDWYYLDEKDEYTYAREFIRETDVVLEIGCGKGSFAKHIFPRKYVGLELSHKAREAANREGIVVLNESIQRHAAINAQAYDVICCFQVLEHVADLRPFIEASIACIKPDGLLIYSVPNLDSFLAYTQNSVLNMPPHHLSWWSHKTLEYVTRLFPLELAAIEDERLSELHRHWYAATKVLRALYAGTGISQKLVDISFIGNLFNKIASQLGKFLMPDLRRRERSPIGHSVTAVYRKLS